jgi:hypothetical protein
MTGEGVFIWRIPEAEKSKHKLLTYAYHMRLCNATATQSQCHHAFSATACYAVPVHVPTCASATASYRYVVLVYHMRSLLLRL